MAVVCAVIISLAAIPLSFHQSASAIPGVATLKNVSKTILSRQATKLVGKLADATDSKILHLTYNYLIGPQGQKLNTLMATTQDILQTVTLIESDLQDLSESVTVGIGELKSLLLQQDVQAQFQQIDQLYAHHAMLWEKYCDLLDMLDGIDGTPTQAQQTQLRVTVEQIRLLCDFDQLREDITEMMGLISDQPLTDDISPEITHNANDPTYVKAVRAELIGTAPFEHQVVLGTRQAVNDVAIPLIRLMTLYGDFAQLEYDMVMDDPDSTASQKLTAQAELELYYSHYNMMINTLDNACDQADVEKLMKPEDVNIKITVGGKQIDAYQVVTNDTGYAVIIAAAPLPELKAAMVKGDGEYTLTALTDAMTIESPAGRQFETPKTQAEYEKIFSTIYNQYADQDPQNYFSVIGCLGKTVDEDGNIVDTYEHGDYFIINDFEKDDPLIGDTNYNFSMLDAHSFSGTTNESQTIDTDSQDVYNGAYDGTYQLIWVDAEGVQANAVTQKVTVSTENGLGNWKVSYSYEGAAGWYGIPWEVVTGSELKVNVYMGEGKRLKSLYCLRQSGEKTYLVEDGDYLAHEDCHSFTMEVPRQDFQLLCEYDDVYSLTVASSGGATITCDVTEQIAGEQVDFKADIPYGYDGEPMLLGLITGNTYPVMEGTFTMPAEPCSLTVDAVLAVPQGEGTEEDPIVIQTRGELEYLSQPENAGLWSKHIRLDADIDLYQRDWQSIGSEQTPFTGTFDGNGYVIECLTVTDKDGGLFGVNNGTIVNVQLFDMTVSTDASTGIVAKTNNGTIANCAVVTGLVSESVSGIVGTNSGSMELCYTLGIGGIEASNGIALSSGALEHCYTDIPEEQYGAYLSREEMIETGFVGMFNHDGGAGEYGFYWTVDTDTNDTYPYLTADSAAGELYGFWDTKGLFGQIICTPALAKEGETVTIEIIEASVSKGDPADVDITAVKALDDQGNEVAFVTDTSFVMPGSNVTFIVEYTANLSQFQGAGTQDDPWLIQNATDLCNLALLCNRDYETYGSAYYRMTADIDMSERESAYTPIGTENQPFNGDFDGNGYVIKSFTMIKTQYAGIFGYTGQTAHIHHLGVEDVTFMTTDTAYSYIGGIAAVTVGGTIDSCYFAGDIISPIQSANALSLVGGIVGQMTNTTISNCYNMGRISGPAAGHLFMQLGGIVGSSGWQLGEKKIVNCYNGGIVNVTKQFDTTVTGGAISGSGTEQGIYNCYFDAENSMTTYAFQDLITGALSDTGAMSPAELKDAADVLGDAFVSAPDDSINGGYPVLSGVGPGKTYEVTLSCPDHIQLQIGSEVSLQRLFQVFHGQDFSFDIYSPEELQSRITVLVDGVPLNQALKTYTIENIVSNMHIELVVDYNADSNPSTGDACPVILIPAVLAAACLAVLCLFKKKVCEV